MTATMLIEDLPVLEKAKRSRKSHHKVRTGCLTCKIRRKKCDEEKPFCRRCTTTGRKCDGYAAAPARTASSSDESPPQPAPPHPHKRVKTAAPANKVAIPAVPPSQPSMQLYRRPSGAAFDTDNESHCFDFFRYRTGPEFAAYFDSSVWRSYIVRACFQHPTVLAAAAAVGAVHRRFELGISREAFEYCDISDQLYRRAMKKLAHDVAGGHPNAVEINVINMKLLSIFETFQGNYDLAQRYMVTGLKGLVGKNFRTTYKEQQYRAVDLNYDSLRRLFLRFEIESVRLFNGPATILSDPDAPPTPVWPLDDLAFEGLGGDPLDALDPLSPLDRLVSLPDPEPYPIPQPFASLAQARDVLFTEAKWIWHTWGLLEQGVLALAGSGFSRHQTHISRLLQWSMAYAEFSKTDTTSRTTQDRRAGHLLKAYREAAYLLLLTQMALHSPDTGAVIVPLCDPPETCDCHRSCRTYAERREALNAHFARLLVLSDSIFNRSSFFAYEEHSLSVDSGIGPPVYRGTRHCRSTKVRHQVTSLLDQSEIQTRVWNTLGVYAIAEKMSSVEEHAVVQCGAVAEELEPKWVDITFFLDERRVLLRYCTPDKEGRGGKLRGTGLVSEDFTGTGTGGLIWTQEWATF